MPLKLRWLRIKTRTTHPPHKPWSTGKSISVLVGATVMIAMVLAVLVVEQVTSDGETHWLEGVQLLSVYLILALLFY